MEQLLEDKDSRSYSRMVGLKLRTADMKDPPNTNQTDSVRKLLGLYDLLLCTEYILRVAPR
jgi:hypothetical protein